METVGVLSVHLVADDVKSVEMIDAETRIYRETPSRLIPPTKITVDTLNGQLVVWNTLKKRVLGERILEVTDGAIVCSSIGCFELRELSKEGGRIAFVLDGVALLVSHIYGRLFTPIWSLGLFKDPIKCRDFGTIMKYPSLPAAVVREF